MGLASRRWAPVLRRRALGSVCVVLKKRKLLKRIICPYLELSDILIRSILFPLNDR